MVELPKISEAQVQSLVLKKDRKAGGSWWLLPGTPVRELMMERY